MGRSIKETQVGPFRLQEKLAGGGMGSVFRADHVRDGTEVAIKIPVAGEDDSDRQRDFRREVQALARLNHPHIATIFDFGTLGEAFEGAAIDELKPGTPWLAMEYVDGEAASRAATRDGWSAFRDRLLAVLDALAHAHAYGVLHRDLKPTNLIVDREAGEIRVVDFGIAAVFESRGSLLDVESSERVRGTPKYMAPEQVLGERNKQGPWTDLYAVGCLAWGLVCGEPPFTGDTDEILRGQLNHQPTGFQPAMSVPPGFRWWLGRLLQKSPSRRPQNAAYAAYHLRHIDYEEGERPESSGRAEEVTTTGPTLQFDDDDGMAVASTQQVSDVSEAGAPARTSDRTSATQNAPHAHRFDPWGAPPIPADWRRSDERRLRPLSVSGLELFGLRRVPVADRYLERDVLWTTLRRVARTGQPNVVLMSGPVGTGKTKLAEWLVRRAEELSAGIGLEVSNDDVGTAIGGIARQILERLGLGGFRGEEAVEEGTTRLEQIGIEPEVGRYHIRGIIEAAGLENDANRAGESVGFDDIDERFAAFRRILRHLGERRPVILHIDDIPRSRTQAQFVRSLFELSDEMSPRMLVVLTATTEAWRTHSEQRTLLEPILQSDHGVSLDVRQLDDSDQREVISRMLRFEESVLDALIEKTNGRPLFAVQVVADWVERGIVRPGGDAFELEVPLEEAMPESLERLWLRRIDEITSRFEEERVEPAKRAVDVAAILGTRVDADIWRQACAKAGAEIPPDLVDELIESGLAHRYDGGWRFEHRLLPEAVRQRAQRAGRAESYHRICAEVLETQSERTPAMTQMEHAANHWEAAGEPERALEAASELFGMLRARRWMHWGEVVLSRMQQLFEALDIDESDKRYMRYRLQRAQLELESSRLAEATSEVQAVLEAAQTRGWTEMVAAAAMTRQTISYRRSRADPSMEALELAEQAYADLEDPVGLGRVLVNRATVLSRLKQDFETAEMYLKRGQDLMEIAGNKRGTMRCEYELSIRALQEGRLDDAERRAHRVIDISEEMQDKSVHCSALNALGEIERYRGNLEKARDYYLRTFREERARGARENEAISLLNLATTEIELEEFDQAEQRFVELLDRMEDSGFGAQYLAANIGMLVCVAARQSPEDWDQYFDDVERALERDEFRYEDHARMAEQAAERAEANGWRSRQRDALRVARDIWDQLGNEQKVERLASELDEF